MHMRLRLLLVILAATVAGWLYCMPGVRLGMAHVLSDARLGSEGLYLVPRTSADIYAYGMRHMSSSCACYDIQVASRSFALLSRIDPQHPRLLHQQARIAFLEGRQSDALLLIQRQIQMHGSTTMASYYIRGLIQGFKGQYPEARDSFFTFLEWDPTNWAALNDLVWVVVKNGEWQRAERIASIGVELHPANAWIANAYATILLHAEKYSEAEVYLVRALQLSNTLTEHDWLVAYPGNDPRTASAGLTAMRNALLENMKLVKEKTAHIHK
jgi:tetratricopeptide (TPR) repeat protein